MDKSRVNYSLYLVTDSTPAILGSRPLAEVVEAAIRGGVGVVQYRDKTLPRDEQIRIARGLHSITSRYGVPLLINDRVDVAVEVGCEGVHVGQDDMNISQARQMLGPDKIIGVSAGNVTEAVSAAECGADYIGIGAVFATPTKEDTKSVLGSWGLGSILRAVEGYNDVKTVCIGGLNASNIQTVIYQSGGSNRPVDGIAVVSAIIKADDPEAEARRLLQLIRSPPPFSEIEDEALEDFIPTVKLQIGEVMEKYVKKVQDRTPLSHNMTNLVVQNFAANVALAIGASPIMSSLGDEAEDLAKLGGGLVVNMGTVTPELLRNYIQAMQAYNRRGLPVVFDPVGAGATAARRGAALKLLSSGYITIIKGNEGELQTLSCLTDPNPEVGEHSQQRGVDSTSSLSPWRKRCLASNLARRLRCIVVLTGKEDFVSNGPISVSVRNGHPAMSLITGTGCALGTTISAFAAAATAERLDVFLACLCAVVYYSVAGEMASSFSNGPGTFGPAFVDQLFLLKRDPSCHADWWNSRALMRNWTRATDVETEEDRQDFDLRWYKSGVRRWW